MDPKKVFEGLVYIGGAYVLAHELPKHIKADAIVAQQFTEDHLTLHLAEPRSRTPEKPRPLPFEGIIPGGIPGNSAPLPTARLNVTSLATSVATNPNSYPSAFTFSNPVSMADAVKVKRLFITEGPDEMG